MSLALEWKGRECPVGGDDRRVGEPQGERRARGIDERRRMRLAFTCFLCTAAFLSGLLILIVFLQVMVVQSEMKTRELEREIDLQRRLHEELRLEIATLESPARIEQIAREHLGMVQVMRAEYLETPAYKAARIEYENRLSDGEGIASDAAQARP